MWRTGLWCFSFVWSRSEGEETVDIISSLDTVSPVARRQEREDPGVLVMFTSVHYRDWRSKRWF